MASKTPKFDAKVNSLLDATEIGERTCPISGEKWVLDQAYLERCRKWNVPPSKLSPFMRMKELASHGAGVDMWWKLHMDTAKPMLTTIYPDAMMPIVSDTEYYARDYGPEAAMDYQASQPFFHQYESLVKSVPSPATYSVESENCVGGGIVRSTNIHIGFGTFDSKDTWYSYRCQNTDRSMDVVHINNSENVFSSAMSGRCNNCIYGIDTLLSQNCAFTYDCWNCEFVFCSTNLRRKKYVFMNEQLTKEAYEAKMKEIDLSCRSQFDYWVEQFKNIRQEQAVWPEDAGYGNEDSTGEYLGGSINVHGWFVGYSKNVLDGWMSFHTEDSESVVISQHSNNCYYTSVALHSRDIKFSFVAHRSNSLEYCVDMWDSEFCFGCRGLRKKKYCIFNKQYSEDEYWKRVDEMKSAMLDSGEYGQYFPHKLMAWWPPLGWSSVISPYTAEERERSRAPQTSFEEGMRHAPYKQEVSGKSLKDVPDCIRDVGEEWTEITFQDPDSERVFRVSKAELEHRKRNGYPFPNKHYRSRMTDLLSQINSPERESRACGNCQKMIVVNKNPSFPDRTVYCRDCYHAFLDSK